MNLVYITADFGVPIFGFKGASIHVREMATALRQCGHAVCVCSPATEEEGTSFGEPASAEAPFAAPAQRRGDFTFLPVAPSPEHVQTFKQLEMLDKFWGVKTRVRYELRNQLYNLALFEAALALARASRVDFVYERYALFNYAGIRLARELGVPHLLEVNAPLAYEQEKMRGLEMKELARDLERHIFSGSDQVLVVSQALQDYVTSCGVASERVRVIPNAVDPRRFVAPAQGRGVRAQYRLENNFVIGFVGSLKPWHGTDTLLEAFNELRRQAPNAHLLIVGEGPARAALEHYAAKYELAPFVTFTGNVPYEQVPEYVAAMDVTVAPYTPHENFYYSPIKIFEYMVMGKPVVAGALGQVKDLIHDGETGLLYEPGNIAQLTAALATLAQDAQFTRAIGEKAGAWVRRERTWENNARMVIEAAQRLMKK
jgi:glycosyltransferase involved in cell wall biosynthesis